MVKGTPRRTGGCAVRSAPKGIGIGLPELERPLPDSFIADDHPAIGRDFFHIPVAQCETEVQPHRVANDLGRVAVASIGIYFLVHRRNLADFSLLGKLPVPAIPVLIVTGSA